MKEAMQGVRSSSSLSDKSLRPTDSNLLHLLNSFSFLILILPCSVLSTICLNSLILVLPCPWDINEHGIVGFKGGTMGHSQSGRGCFPVIPLGMVIVRVKKEDIKKFHEDKMDCNMAAEKEKRMLA